MRMLEEAFSDLKGRLSVGKEHKFTLNRYLLREVIESCFCDMYRLKFFREVHNLDIHKRAAFFMVWIAKIRPIQYVSGTFQTKEELLINEQYAIYVGIGIMQIPPRFFLEGLESYYINLLYLLHNRETYPEQLASEMFLIDRLACATGVRIANQ